MKTKKLLLLSFLFLPITMFAQVNVIEQEKNRQLQNEINQSDQINGTTPSLISNNSGLTTSARILADLDLDGMDDDWEMANGLDATNPKDAFEDADNDHILNLFEYQLDSDPNSMASPAVATFSPSGDIAILKEMVEAAEGDTKVIRLSQGDYSSIGTVIFNDGYRLMIQGGWNDDFSDYDPDQYVTNWNGLGNEVAVLLWLGIDINDTSTVIMEGIQFSAQDYFSLYGTIQVTNNQGHANVSMSDCSFANSEYSGFGFVQRHPGTTGDLFMINSVLGNNLRGGIYSQITDSAESNWRIINTTISNPGSSDGGIDGLTNSAGVIAAKIVNSIIWGNTTPSLNLSSLANATFDLTYSNIDPPANPSTIINDQNNIDENPLFVDPAGSDWTLQGASPCVDTGIDIGFPFFDAAPEMGAFELGSCVATSSQLLVTACDSYDYNGDVLEVGGTYNYTFTNAAGCDSTVSLILSIETLTAEIMANGMMLTASPAGAGYQWIDCSDNSIITGANSQVFNPTASGSYAVEITSGGCVETSDCANVIISNTKESEFQGLKYFPNPVEELLTIDFGIHQDLVQLMVTNISGKELHSWEINNKITTNLDVSAFATGMYYLTLQSGEKMQVLKFVKN